MKPASYCIGIIDDDAGMRRALGRLLAAEGFEVRSWPSAASLLADADWSVPDCLLLDVAMPGMDGLDLQRQLADRPGCPPLIFLTGKGNVPMAVRAMQAGAVNFLTKPVSDDTLFPAIRATLADARELRELRQRYENLTPREKEVFTHIIAGKLNKQIAADLGTGEQTIKVHRMRVTRKLGKPSVAELVWLANRIGVLPAT
jgi:FixJ family two-component response regulator